MLCCYTTTIRQRQTNLSYLRSGKSTHAWWSSQYRRFVAGERGWWSRVTTQTGLAKLSLLTLRSLDSNHRCVEFKKKTMLTR